MVIDHDGSLRHLELARLKQKHYSSHSIENSSDTYSIYKTPTVLTENMKVIKCNATVTSS